MPQRWRVKAQKENGEYLIEWLTGKKKHEREDGDFDEERTRMGKQRDLMVAKIELRDKEIQVVDLRTLLIQCAQEDGHWMLVGMEGTDCQCILRLYTLSSVKLRVEYLLILYL
ncbi:unnamed protein product [Dovyalis caffra]|uniref:Uncharacterized protein n=1 Tax=Dovyalis caffra TaxID=77055 RepID=A0AAV1SAF7_9ROSI|nr:unnamed protein product [Dovyalis caffra]